MQPLSSNRNNITSSLPSASQPANNSSQCTHTRAHLHMYIQMCASDDNNDDKLNLHKCVKKNKR